MNEINNYGVVYTPEELATFVAKLLKNEYIGNTDFTVLDPACGEGILLEQVYKCFCDKKHQNVELIGIDIDNNVIENNKKRYNSQFKFISQNTILPSTSLSSKSYWKHRIHNKISMIIANPPWSSEKIFEKEELKKAKYSLYSGQYDAYVLFIELSISLLEPNGIAAFIIPDSLFSGENKTLRKFLVENTNIRVLARLGEKIFPNINRATSVIVIENSKVNASSKTKCYRLNTEDRKNYLSGKLDLFDNFLAKSHSVQQCRFLENENYVFDIDVREDEEKLLSKVEKNKIDWESVFRFGRGVEISKSGKIVICEHCKMAQGYTKKQFSNKRKKCQFCGETTRIDEDNTSVIISEKKSPTYKAMYVGENLQRYGFCGKKYILPDVGGINYKDLNQYKPPKILIRKTGLGIYASIDYESTLISQTVYSCNYLMENDIPLEYYLGVINSRVLYYYYLKKYGENEWKSHPYLTKDIIFSLPIKNISDKNRKICFEIASIVKSILKEYTREKDIKLEKKVFELYEISNTEKELIISEINNLPNLSAINQMKIRGDEINV